MQHYKVDLNNMSEEERRHALEILKLNSFDWDQLIPFENHVYSFYWNSNEDILSATGLSTDRVEPL